ncbi:hypothetical protein [Micromonospora noduli]|uniref:hypothetical protein n=1 Tax=Micromonospora noduli TaxID=709876 RepID=UPI000DD93927|nr:hypothetical protein [Micromonospora noduli]
MAGAFLLASALLPGSPAVAADTGDGWEPCNRGEICLYQAQYAYVDSNNGSRQFWYDDMNHRDDRFWLPNQNEYGIVVMDKVKSVHNKDTQCGVRMWDVNGSGTWYVYQNIEFGGAYYNQENTNPYNNGHDRYPC